MCWYTGLLVYEDFKRVFQLSEDELESRAIGVSDGSSNFESIPPKFIPELVDLNKVWFFYDKNNCDDDDDEVAAADDDEDDSNDSDDEDDEDYNAYINRVF